MKAYKGESHKNEIGLERNFNPPILVKDFQHFIGMLRHK